MMLGFWKNEGGEKDLDSAVSLWRSVLAEPDERLSADARSRIVRDSVARQETAPVPVGVRLAAWKLLGGALPVAAAVLLVLVVAGRDGRRDTPAPIRVIAEKAGQDVVFSIRNGHRAHSVLKSRTPDRFDGSSRIPVRNGSFRDSMDDGSGLVFYRID